jgi:phenylacetate-CoA ligase
MRKDDVLKNQLSDTPFGSRLSVPRESVVLQHISGGTSGRGQEAQGLTQYDRMQIAWLFAYGFYFAGVERGDVVAMTFPITTSSGGTAVYDSLVRLHARVLPVASYDTLTKLRLMKQHRARVLLATPAYLKTLEVAAREQLGWDLAKELDIEIILTATEAFSIKRVETIEKEWGAKLFEWYGSSQRAGASNCEYGAVHEGKRGLLHHYPHLVLLETLNRDTQKPVEYGEEGEVVVTFLSSEASPLIRFATNDRVRLLPASYCSCGRCSDGYESGTVSRYDDMMKIRGLNLWPVSVDDVVLTTPGVRDYCGRVTRDMSGREDIDVEIEFDLDVPSTKRSEINRSIEAQLRAVVGLRMNIREASQKLPEFKDSESKARRWRDERNAK